MIPKTPRQRIGLGLAVVGFGAMTGAIVAPNPWSVSIFFSGLITLVIGVSLLRSSSSWIVELISIVLGWG